MGLQRREVEVDRRRVSPIYAKIGPVHSQSTKLQRRDWRAWRAEYGEQWDAGVAGTPPPPHAELFRYAM